MRRPDWSLTIAICVSLCVHEWLIHKAVEADVEGGRFGPFIFNHQPPGRAQKKLEPIELVRLPAKAKPPPPAVPREEEPVFGQRIGGGQAINSMQGSTPLRAKQAPFEQAILSRQPGVRRDMQPVKPKLDNLVKNNGARTGGNNGAAEKMLAALEPRPAAAMAMVGLPDSPKSIALNASMPASTEEGRSDNKLELKTQSLELKAPHPNPPPAYQGREPNPARPQLQPVAKAQNQNAPGMAQNSRPQAARPAMMAEGSGGGNLAGRAGNSQASISGDPGEKSDSDSDAFSNTGSVTFEPGHLEARFGRKVRTVRPNFPLSARMDLMAMAEASVQLEVHVDSTGKPTDVDLLQSSGSPNVDEAIRLAIYDWWFEPPKDSAGKPKADVTVWTISIR